MEISDVRERPDVSAEQRTSSELAKLVRKLRWIGMEAEAEQMQFVLRRVDLAAILLAGPFDVSRAALRSSHTQNLRSPNLRSVRRRRSRHEAKLRAETEHSRLTGRKIEHGLADALHRNGAQQAPATIAEPDPFP